MFSLQSSPKLLLDLLESPYCWLGLPLSQQPLGKISVGLTTAGCHEVSLLAPVGGCRNVPDPVVAAEESSLISTVCCIVFEVNINPCCVCRVHVFLCSMHSIALVS